MQPAMERQAWVVRTVLSQLGRQEAAGEEAPNGIAGEFARLKIQSNKYRTDRTFPTRTAEKQENVKRNRYKDIVPFDHSRVRLTLTTSKNDTDYINASFIKGVSGSRAYIATQGPLPHTVVDFLRMLWEYDIKVVVMACREFEMGKKKCECYWPQKQGQPFVCEPFTVYCDSEENRDDYLTRTLRLNYLNHSRTLKQLHYVSWPDHGVPDSIPPILEMLEEMQIHQAHEDVPICIHCSAGCGRTGALCVIDYTWDLLKKQMITPDFKIFDLVQNMRTQRHSLVQTKEQYELVYRTIQLLFDRYLQSVDALSHRSEVVSSAVTPEAESGNEELDLTPQFQHLLDEERHVLRQNHAENLTAPKAKDQQQWHQLQSLPEAQTPDRGLQRGSRTSPALVRTSQGAPDVEEERIQETGSKPSLDPPPLPAVAAAICLMVEDPYFDSPMGSPSSEEAPKDSSKHAERWTVNPAFSTPSVSLSEPTEEPNPPASGCFDTDEEAAPPLPQRTPESYVLAQDAERPDPYGRLTVVVPPTAAGEAVRELGGSPPSPVPPLPERTPESFELAVDPAPEGQRSKVALAAVNLSRIGTSSEWAGNSKPAAMATQHDVKSWVRSKSLKAKMTFRVPQPDLPSNAASPQDRLAPPPPQTAVSPTPPLPDRTPESFVLTLKEEEEEESEFHRQASVRSQPPESTHPSTRVGLSSEWDGASQPKKFLDAVKIRSKSVRAKSSNQASEPLTADQLFTSPPLVVAEGGSAQVPVNRKPPVNAETSGNKSEKSMTRTKSLKFFRHKPKTKITPPPPPAAAQANGTSSSVFRFGFGRRLGKPKGPRSYPETWV